ncbi:hypothetical protein EON66_11170 [archaeon]|nr:MAG: hypothetical protein EON66_11170 [archaeon]
MVVREHCPRKRASAARSAACTTPPADTHHHPARCTMLHAPFAAGFGTARPVFRNKKEKPMASEDKVMHDKREKDKREKKEEAKHEEHSGHHARYERHDFHVSK